MHRRMSRLVLVSLLLAALATPTPRGIASTVELLGYEPSTQMLYWVQHGDAPTSGPGWLVRRPIDAPADRSPSPVGELVTAQVAGASDSLHRLVAGLSKVFPAPGFHLVLQASPGAADSVLREGRWYPRRGVHVELLDVDREGRLRVLTVGGARVGFTGLYRIANDDREVAVLSYTAMGRDGPAETQVPVVLSRPGGYGSSALRPLSPALLQPAAGDSLATLVGRVVGKDGNPVAFANVIVLGTKQGTATDEQGRFRLTGLAPGPCRVLCLGVGYERVITADTLRLGVNPPLHLMFGPMLSVTDAGDDLRQSAPCPTWFAIPHLQGDHRLPRGQLLIDGTGPGGDAEITGPRGNLAIAEAEEGCALRLVWSSSETVWPTHIAILDKRGAPVREFDAEPPGQRWESSWDGLETRGAPCPAGVYVARASTGDAAVELWFHRRSR